MAASTPRATFTADTHRYQFRTEQVEVILERFEKTRDGDIRCEMIVNGLGGQLMPRTRTNLMAPQTVSRTAGDLAKRTPAELDIDWTAIMTVIAATSVERYRQGDAPVDLTKVSGWREKPRYLLHPFIESGGDTVIFADGGTGKSTFASICGVMVVTGLELLPECKVWTIGPVLYLDWEADAETHAERLEAIRQAYAPPLDIPEGQFIYKRMYAPLDDAVDEIRGLIAKYGIVLVIIDSLGRARGGSVNDDSDTNRMFAAARRLLVPTLCIDHISKQALFSGGPFASRPIGSTYTHDNARLTWSITAGGDAQLNEEGQENGLRRAIRLTNHKNNNGRINRPRTYSIQYWHDENDRLTQIFVDTLADGDRITEFLGMLPVWKRARMFLEEHGPMTTLELAGAMNAKQREVEQNLAAWPTIFLRVVRGDGPDQWELLPSDESGTLAGQSDFLNGDVF